MDIPTREKLLSYKNFLPQKVQKEFPEFCEMLLQQYPNKTITECCYLYFNSDKDGKCNTCGNPTKFLSFTRGYQEFCCKACSNSNLDKVKKKEQTCLERYGATNVFASEYGKNKIVETNRKKYGVDYPQQSKEIHAKSKQTCLERYGVEYYSSTEESRKHKSFIKEETTKKVRKTAHDNFLASHPDVIEFENGWFTMKCPDSLCNKCKEKVFRIPQYILYGRHSRNMDVCTVRTPISDHGNTSPELFIHKILKDNNIEFITCNRSIISPKEIDIYIPSKNIAIECNGLYWHSSIFKDSHYHFNKWQACKNQEIQLLTIWEDWIMTKPNIVESIILSKLGIYKQIIGARECDLKEVSSKESNEFLLQNHIQGKSTSSVRLGLYYNNDLVALMTFGQSRMNIGKLNKSNNEWELIRFCTKLNTQVIGGANKLFKHFVSTYDPNMVKSFASHDISNGGLYENVLGFKINNIIKSTYWYIDKQTIQRLHRSNFRKEILIKNGADPNLTEEQIMLTTEPYCNKYLKIYDSGQSTYIWNKIYE